MALTKKQSLFVAHYLGKVEGSDTRWNATQSAIAAGYSERSAASIGHENLRKPEIAAEIQRQLDEMTMGRDELLVELGEQARLDIGPYVRMAATGPTLDVQKMIADGLGKWIKGIRQTREGVYVELHDSFAAKQILAKYHGLLRDLNLNIDMSSLSEDALQRIASGEDPLKVIASGL